VIMSNDIIDPVALQWLVSPLFCQSKLAGTIVS